MGSNETSISLKLLNLTLFKAVKLVPVEQNMGTLLSVELNMVI